MDAPWLRRLPPNCVEHLHGFVGSQFMDWLLTYLIHGDVQMAVDLRRYFIVGPVEVKFIGRQTALSVPHWVYSLTFQSDLAYVRVPVGDYDVASVFWPELGRSVHGLGPDLGAWPAMTREWVTCTIPPFWTLSREGCKADTGDPRLQTANKRQKM
jgi:hypothetical protein